LRQVAGVQSISPPVAIASMRSRARLSGDRLGEAACVTAATASR
jgi:hypothetical protein